MTVPRFNEEEITYIDMARVLIAGGNIQDEKEEAGEEDTSFSVEEIVEYFDVREWTAEQEEEARQIALQIALKESEMNLENRQDT